MKKIGVLGGTFDPFHYGHLSIAKSALKEFHLDKIVLLPSNVQPFKIGRKMASPEDRVNMAKIISEEHPDFELLTQEAFSGEISYTYKTMHNMKEQLPDCTFYFILGTDSFLSIESWYESEKLIRENSFIIGERPGYKEEETYRLVNRLRGKYNASIGILNNEILEISSTEIKEKIKRGISISEMVPQSIERYILEHGLYR